MEENKIKADNEYLGEVQRNFKLTKKIEKYENKSLTTQMLAKAKQSIWHNINANIRELWPSFQIIFEQEELLQRVKVTVEQKKAKTEHKPGKDTKLLKC